MKTDSKINIIGNNISRDAADWLSLMKAGGLTSETEKSFYIWLSEDPAHQDAYEEILSIWDDAASLSADPLVVADLKEDWVEEKRLAEGKWFHKLAIGFMPLRHLAVAATVLFIVAGIWLVQYKTTSPMIYQTVTGEQKTVYLSDGSTLCMDTETTVSVSFTRELRHIDLVTGRSLFSVAHDPDRPFVVTTGPVAVRAIGTQFNIYKEKTGKMSVAVTEGEVQVSSKKQDKLLDKKIISGNLAREVAFPGKLIHRDVIRQPDLFKATLVTGQKIIINEHNADYEIKTVDTDLVKDWTDGRLSFYKAPLPEVIEEINRYLETKIYIKDSRLNDLEISLTFKIAHRYSFLKALKKVMPIRSQVTIHGKIFLTKKE